MALLGALHHPPRAPLPAAGGVSIDEFRSDASQQESHDRHVGRLALDHETESWRQGRRHYDAVEVARVIRHQHAGALRQMLVAVQPQSQAGEGEPEAREPPRGRTAPVQRRQQQSEQRGRRRHQQQQGQRVSAENEAEQPAQHAARSRCGNIADSVGSREHCSAGSLVVGGSGIRAQARGNPGGFGGDWLAADPSEPSVCRDPGNL